ncbi:MAG: bifunctional diguanylate cyclase/phosphodiesterase [Solirubrobacterales bacterium]|nr:bifunctional diguanylate cyclase/phosphodiesterase [Solirubrobacterales bacterium]
MQPFDHLMRLTTAALGVPVALVSLVETRRQVFAGQHGLTGEWARTRQTPLSHSFCQYAVATRQPFVVSDAHHDPRVADHLAVRDLGVIAYAGMPLVLRDGSAVGALCAIDKRRREWTAAELVLLKDISHAVAEILDLRAAVAREGLYDRLTGLPNRSLLVAHAEQLMHRQSGRDRLVAMCVGIDDFTEINQALGADSADAVLRAAGERLAGSLRAGDILGRLRGDIFTILAEHIEDQRGAFALAGRVRAALSDSPLQIGDERLSVSATIGIAIANECSKAGDLISESASAMRHAKQHHTRTRIAEHSWGRLAASQLRLREALRGALAREEIRAVFQPIVDLETGTVRGYETIARWQHPELGDVRPDQFIGVAETTADIIAIGRFILDQGCEQVARWRDAGAADLVVTVNLAPLQLEQPNLTDVVDGILRRAGLPATALILEITERVLLKGEAIELENLVGLRRLGVRIALDDFGTGYSALGYLKRFPIDMIKIDRSFIRGMEDERADTALIQAILAMANGMNIDLVAEGIETPGQRQLLRLLGCRYGQGFLFARPAPAADLDPAATF